MSEPKTSRRAHLSAICKIGTCGKTTTARGMCNSHYQDWRRSHNAPLAKSRDDTADMIKEAMPATRRQIQAHTGFVAVTILKYLPTLRAAGEVFVADHEPPIEGRGRWQPVYAVGNKPDKVLTAARRKQYAEDCQAKKKAQGAQVVVRVPKSKWSKPSVAPQTPFSALFVVAKQGRQHAD